MPAKSGKQRSKEYRERMKLDSDKYLRTCLKERSRKQMKLRKMKMPENSREYEQFKQKDRERKQVSKQMRVRWELEEMDISSGRSRNESSSSSAASLAKSVYKVKRNMPRRKSTKVNVVSKIIKAMTPASKKSLLKITNLTYDPSRRQEQASTMDDRILKFLEQPDISYVCPGRKDTVYVGKDERGESIYRAKHFLRWTLDEILSMYNDGKDDCDTVSYYRVQKVVSQTKHLKLASEKPDDDCRCEQCENVELILDSIYKTLRKEDERDMAHNLPDDGIVLAKSIVCDIHNLKCVSAPDKCRRCSGLDTEYKDTLSFISNIAEVRLKQWKKVEGKVRKIETVESGKDVVALLKEKVEKKGYLVHVYNIFRQFREFKTLKENIDRDEAIVTVDFARNYDNKQAAEIQSAYFGHDTFTLYTVCCYLRGEDGELESIPLGIVSNEANHDRNVSFTSNQMVIHYLRSINPNLKSLYLWSDCCARQFRSRFVFKSLLLYPNDLQISWDYGEVSHFKGPHDGMGGTIKRSVYQAVQQNKVVINTAKEFADAANIHTRIKVLYLDKTKIEYPDLDGAQAIPGTLKVHHVKRNGTELIFKLNSPYFRGNEPEFSKLDYTACNSGDGHPAVSPDENSLGSTIFQLKVGSFYKVRLQCLDPEISNSTKESAGRAKQLNYDTRIARLESHTDNGGTFTLLTYSCKRTGRSYYKEDTASPTVQVELENITSQLPEPGMTRRGVVFWE